MKTNSIYSNRRQDLFKTAQKEIVAQNEGNIALGKVYGQRSSIHHDAVSELPSICEEPLFRPDKDTILTCIIIDNEHRSQIELEELITQIDSVHLKGIFSNTVDAHDFLQNNSVDVIIIDADSSEFFLSAFIRTLAKRPEIIITSAKEKNHLKILTDVVGTYFLPKPVSLKPLLKIMSYIENKLTAIPRVTNGHIYVKANNQLTKLSLTSLHYIEAYGDYVNIYTDTHRYIVHSTMKQIEQKLPSDEFVRVHRSYIVRIDKILTIDKSIVTLSKKTIPIGDSYYDILMSKCDFF